MRAVVTLSTVLVLFICHGRIAAELFTCSNDTTDFATRVQGSSTVVYGQARAKELHQGSDTLFYVQFQVDCILKGPATSRTINITEAGFMANRRHCQNFAVARTRVIAFLDRHPVFENHTNFFIAADFTEMPYQGNTTDQLLAKTCDLRQVLPLESSTSVADMCPAVSTDARCVSIVNTTATMTILLPGAPNQVVDLIRGKSATIQVDADRSGGMISASLSLVLILVSNLALRWD